MKRIIVIFTICNFVLLSYLLYRDMRISTPRMGYIRTVDLFNEFTLKKKLSMNYESINSENRKVLDSFKVQLLSLQNQIKSATGSTDELKARYQLEYEKYVNQNRDFESDSKSREDKYNDIVWAQLNQYIKDYGEEQEVEVIFGASGTGNLMYCQEAWDMTDELIKYANERYEGTQTDN
ncbi:hypothetical protein GC194_02185 [bacterium]|nr:hypothetical protein [bacterium]